MGEDTGTSSKTIWAVMMGGIDTPRKIGGRFDIPCHPEDFGRCHRLLNLMPEWRKDIGKVAELFPAWQPFVDAWAELEGLYTGEMTRSDARAPDLYARMKELERDARIIDGWKEKAPGFWSWGEE